MRPIANTNERGIKLGRSRLSQIAVSQGNPAQRAEAIVKATTFYDDPDVLAKVSRGLGEPMVGINVDDIPQPHRLAQRGW